MDAVVVVAVDRDRRTRVAVGWVAGVGAGVTVTRHLMIVRLTEAVPTRRLALVDGLEGHVPAPVGSHGLLMILVLVVAGRGGPRRRGHRASLRRGESLEEEVVVVAVIERARHHGRSKGRRRGRRRVRRGSMTLVHAGISIGRVGGHEGVASAGPRAGRVAHLDARAGANRHREIGLLRRRADRRGCGATSVTAGRHIRR